MHLVKQALVALVHVDLLLVTATHGRPQLARQRVLALLQLTQQGWGDGDVVAAAGHTRSTQDHSAHSSTRLTLSHAT